MGTYALRNVVGKRVGLLAGLLVLTLGSGVVAQEPSPEPPPWFGGRVEMPDYYFAVTLPDDWVAFDLTVDTTLSQWEAALDSLDPAVWSLEAAAAGRSLADFGRGRGQLAFVHTTSLEMCHIGALYRGPDVSSDLVDRAAAGLSESIGGDPETLDVEPPERVDLPVGPASLIRMSTVDGRSLGYLLLRSDEFVYMVLCTTDDVRPDDDWLSIAETFEFLPAEEWSGLAEPSPSAAGNQAAPLVPLDLPVEGGVVEMAGSGFAITFSGDWTVELADPDPDVYSVKPGAAWEALRAIAQDGSMACSVVVGVAAVPLRGTTTAQDGVEAPFWDPDERDRLWVPTPDLPKTSSTHETSWIRHLPQDDDLDRDVQYELLCAANNAVVSRPAPTFMRLMETFEFRPAEE